MKKEDLKVGMKVRIRQWDDMAKEFGFTSSEQAIKCPSFLFPESMGYLCGTEIIVEQLEILSSIIAHIGSYYITYYMIEPLEIKNKNNKREVKMNKKLNINLPEDVKIVFINGRNVTVELLDGKKGTAVCNEKDEFDSYTGFTIAYFKAKFSKNFELKRMLNKSIDSAKKRGYKTAIIKNGV